MSYGTIPGTIVFGILNAKIGKKYTLIVVASLIALTTFLPMRLFLQQLCRLPEVFFIFFFCLRLFFNL